MMSQNIEFESRHCFWLWMLYKHSLLSGKSEGLPGDPVSDLRAVSQSFSDSTVPECLLMATAQSIFASQDISAPHSARPVVVEALSIALSPGTHINLAQACISWISQACFSVEGLGILLNIFYECCSWFFNGRCESTAAMERVGFVLEKLLRGLFVDHGSIVDYKGSPSSTGNLIFQFLYSSLPLSGSMPKLMPYPGDQAEEGILSTNGDNTLSNLLNACIMSRESEAVRLRGFRTLAMVIVAAEERHKTPPTVFTAHSLELFAANFIEGGRRGTTNNGIRDSFQQKLRLCSLAWDVVILVPHARCTLVGGDCNDRPAGPLLRELLLKNKEVERGKQPCMLQTIATYKAGQLISFWLREQDCKPSHQYEQKNATASGTTNEWMPINLLIALLQRYSNADEGEEGSLVFKAIEKLLSRLCQWKHHRRADALAMLAMKKVVKSTLKDREWGGEECNYYHDNGIMVDESGGQDTNEEYDDTILGSSLTFSTPPCLIHAIPVLRLLDAILSHSARQETLRTLAMEINQSALDANFKDIRANAIASWLLGCQQQN